MSNLSFPCNNCEFATRRIDNHDDQYNLRPVAQQNGVSAVYNSSEGVGCIFMCLK